MKVSYEQYHSYSAPLEGRVPTFYCDILGLITIAVGNLVNTLPQALALPMLLADGTKADQADIAADWHKLHDNAAYYAKRAWMVYTNTMRCHLDDAGIDALVRQTLAANEAIIRKRFPAWDTFPADAQLAIMSIAWAVGAGFYVKFTNLAHCIDAQDWEACVATCKIREEGNPGVVPRNAKNRFCFHNAAIVKNCKLDAEKLFWPETAIYPFEPAERGQAVVDAKAESEAALAAWHANPLNRFVDAAYAAVQDELNEGSGKAIRDFEAHDTDPAPPLSESEPNT